MLKRFLTFALLWGLAVGLAAATLTAQEKERRDDTSGGINTRSVFEGNATEAPSPSLQSGPPISFELQPGESRRFFLDPPILGEASIWADSNEVDVRIEVRGPLGDVLGSDDNSGGGSAAHLFVSVMPDTRIAVTVTAESDATPAASGRPTIATVRLAAVTVAITEATTEQVRRLTVARERMLSLSKRGEYAEVREIAESVLRDVLTTWDTLADSKRLNAISRVAYQAFQAGEHDLAGRLWRLQIAAYEQMLPDSHPDSQRVRMNYANMLISQGDYAAADAPLRSILDARERTLPEDADALQKARLNYARNLKGLEDLHGARTLEQRVLEVWERTLPPDNANLQAARVNYALTLGALGDLASARALEEAALEVF